MQNSNGENSIQVLDNYTELSIFLIWANNIQKKAPPFWAKAIEFKDRQRARRMITHFEKHPPAAK